MKRWWSRRSPDSPGLSRGEERKRRELEERCKTLESDLSEAVQVAAEAGSSQLEARRQLKEQKRAAAAARRKQVASETRAAELEQHLVETARYAFAFRELAERSLEHDMKDTSTPMGMRRSRRRWRRLAVLGFALLVLTNAHHVSFVERAVDRVVEAGMREVREAREAIEGWVLRKLVGGKESPSDGGG